jgi:two-component system clock-associated histidine kinase SasA
VVQANNGKGDSTADTAKTVSLHLLLFIDRRPGSEDYIEQLQSYLQSLQIDAPFELQVVELAEHPHLVEYYKLIATPALVKVSPAPRQTLAGSNIIAQLKKWWPQWQASLEKPLEDERDLGTKFISRSNNNSVSYSAELIKLSDDIFSLQREKEELLEQLKFKDQILAMLAHDLRSPLTAASIAVETLEIVGNYEENDRVIKLKEQLYKQAKNQFQIMNRMITDLLEASKTMSAQFKVQPRRLYLQSLCGEIVTLFVDRLEKKSQKLEMDIPQDLPPVYADEELVRQVIVNLLDNANKYTPEGGKISLSILHRTSQKIQVSVCDDGPGIPEEKREHIFEGHFRLQRDEAQEGYGLGLSLCRKVIRAHCGQIWVDSIFDRGSCFHFTLPVCQ